MGPIARCRCVAGVLLGLTLVGPGAPSSSGVGPPAAGPVRLTVAQEKRLRWLEGRRAAAGNAGRMGEALRLAQEVESLRRQSQGARHWETIDARHAVEEWGRLARLSPAAQQKATQTLHLAARANGLHARGQYALAEQGHREALAICRKALGEDHPHTASTYNNVAACLQAQGQAAQALPLAEKALAIRKKALGEEHPDTAMSYNYVAMCLHEQGQAAQALPVYEKALAIRRKALGEGHPDTGQSYHNVASCLQAQGQAAQALPPAEKALAIIKKALGEDHPHTAPSYNSVASCLDDQGKHVQALPLYEKALAIRKKALGEGHPDTAISYNNVAACLQAQGQAAQALPLFEKALAIWRKVLGEGHPHTAISYNNIAYSLQASGQAAQALPLYEKALAIRKKALGEEHPDTAGSYNNLAACLNDQGKHAQALPLYEKALAIWRKALGEGHPHTASSYNNVAACLNAQGKHAQALPLAEKALAIWRKALGEAHADTARGYNSVAFCLDDQGKHAQALPLYEKALAICRKALGEDHPHTATSYNNVAACLQDQGKHAQALPVYEKALAIRKKALGDEHPDTAMSYNNIAICLHEQGKHQEAIKHWQLALLGHDFARLARAESGFDRARAGANRPTPREGLALAHARRKEADKAWQHAEANLARNLLDDRAGRTAEDASLLHHLGQLDQRLTPLFGLIKPTPDQKALRDELTRQRRTVLQRLAKNAADRSAANVWSLARIQEQLPADAAVVLWVTANRENWGCVLRSRGQPRWQQLTGTGPKGAWTNDDHDQPKRLHAALADDRTSATRRRALTEAIQKRWFAPLEKSLGAEGQFPAVKRLFVVSSKPMGGLPVEVLAPGYTMSYTPSATVLAKALKGHRTLKVSPALALGDPVFHTPTLAAAPKHGVLVGTVQANGPADKAGLRAGDVLVRYDNTKLEGVADLVAALKKSPNGKATYWRDGKEAIVALSSPLGISIDRRPAPEAVKAFRAANTSATCGEVFAPLPGTRAEVLALQRLLGKGCRTLLGSAASEQALDAMSKELKTYRILHLATHGTIDLAFPERSSVILARDKLPTLSENAERAASGKRPYTGELTVHTILNDWKLDADLVVLSACQTGLGAQSSGDGLLGFSYALMRVGARSVVLSRWKVDDKATALLMVRFYENLLGQAKGLKGPMGRADALAEAKRWLRELPRKDAERLAVALGANRLAGTRGSIVDLVVKEGPKLPAGERPYEHPFFWAAFTLVGDPD